MSRGYRPRTVRFHLDRLTRRFLGRKREDDVVLAARRLQADPTGATMLEWRADLGLLVSVGLGFDARYQNTVMCGVVRSEREWVSAERLQLFLTSCSDRQILNRFAAEAIGAPLPDL